MKHPLWKKRLKKLLKDTDVIFPYFFCSGIAGAMLSALSMFPVLFFDWSILWTISIAFGLSFLGVAAAVLWEIFYDKELVYDEEIQEEEEELAKASEMERQLKLKRLKEAKEEGENRLKEAINGLPKKEIEVALQSKKLYNSIQRIKHTYSLEKDEEHYIHYALPHDVASTLSFFSQMNRQNREECRASLLKLLEEKEQQIEEDISVRHEHKRKQAFKQQLTVTERRSYH